MEERENRFIIFPLDEEDEVSEESTNEVVVPTEENLQEKQESSLDVSESSLDDVHSSQEESGQVENPLDSSDLGELGVIQKDEDGRIIFSDDSVSPSFEQPVVEEDVTSSESEEEISPVLPDDSSSIDIDSYSEETEIEGYSENSKSREFQTNRNLQDMINQILKIDDLKPVEVEFTGQDTKEVLERKRNEEEQRQKNLKEEEFRREIIDVVTQDDAKVIFQSDLLEKLNQESIQTNTFSMLVRYGEDYCSKNFVTNPAIGREEEIKQLILTLLTPEKSAILVGKPGIGKTSIVEGLAYRLQRGLVPEALQGYAIVNIKTPSLIGTLPNGETRLQSLVDELKKLDKIILFIDEIHMLIGATNESSMDFANMFKEGLGRGQIKIIGATTTEEYERYILRDKAFVRRFQSIEVLEPSREHTIKILMGTLPKIEKDTGAKLKYTTFIQSEIMGFIVDITSEYKRIYGIGSRYPDICLTLLKEAFSQCIFDNRNRVTIFDIRDAIENSKNIYPDVIRKELPRFDEKFKKIIDEENADDASIDRL